MRYKAQFQKAKTAIDAASEHESTMNQPKTWHYYAVIYYKIGAYPEFVDIDMNAYEKVLGAFVKIQNLDKEYFMRNAGEFKQYASSVGASYYDLGANSYNEGDFENAYINFKKAYDAMAVLGGKDNSALLNAALCAVKIDKNDEAIEMFQTLIANGMDEPKVYQSLTAAYRGAYLHRIAVFVVDNTKENVLQTDVRIAHFHSLVATVKHYILNPL